MKNIACGIVASTLLLNSTPTWACPQCRPGVEAGIYNAGFGSNLLMLLLPLLILFLIGIALHYSDTIISRLRKPKGTIACQTPHNAAH